MYIIMSQGQKEPVAGSSGTKSQTGTSTSTSTGTITPKIIQSDILPIARSRQLSLSELLTDKSVTARDVDEITTTLTLKRHQMDRVSEMLQNPSQYIQEKKNALDNIKQRAHGIYEEKLKSYIDAGMPAYMARIMVKPIVQSEILGEMSQVEFNYPETITNIGAKLGFSPNTSILNAIESASASFLPFEPTQKRSVKKKQKRSSRSSSSRRK
jgi:hypothetical protein